MTYFMKKAIAVSTAAICLLGSMLPFSASAAQEYLLGDVNMDSHIDTKDATMILQEYVRSSILHEGSSSLSDFQKALSDISQDGGITEVDAIYALKYYGLSMLGQTPNNWQRLQKPATSNGIAVSIGGRSLQIGIPADTLTAQLGQPAASFSEARKSYTLTYNVYEPASKNMLISIADGGTIVGYFGFGTSISAGEGVSITQYTDSLGTKKTYCGLVLKSGYSLDYSLRSNLTDFQDYSKLCWYVTNGVRAVNGLSEMKWCADAAGCATTHSKEMAQANQLEHNSPNGTSFSQRLSNAGINWRACAENIDGGYSTFIDAVDGWYNSSGHRKNILTEYKHLGVGFAYRQDSTYKLYGTQDFYTAMNE